MEVENTENLNQGGTDEVAALYEKFEAGEAGETETRSADIPAAQSLQQQPQAPTWDGKQWEFEWSGKKIVPDSPDKVKRWASQGYDYAQKMEAFKKQQAEVNQTAKSYDKYKTIDEYVKKDPQWWSFVEEQYNNRLASEDPVVQRVKGMLEEKLAPYEQILAQKQQQEQEVKIKNEDNALVTEIKSIREKYSNLDFDSPDADGKSLEYRVLEHGASKGFPSFKSAFLDFYHDQLEKMWESRGREAVAKGAQAQAKTGFSVSTSPSKPKKETAFDPRGKSWQETYQSALSELNL